MTTRIRLYITAAAVVIITASGYSLWSHFQIRRAENAVDEAKANAAQHRQHSDELEQRSRVYEEKIVFLETSLETLKTLAKKQDEELKALESNSNSARADVERAHRIRTAAATADEVCRKLAELGHPCEQ